MFRRGVASAAVAFGLVLGLGGASAGAGLPVSPAAHASAASGNGAPHSTPDGIRCLATGEYCSQNPGYADAYHRAGFRCDAAGRLEYD